MTALVDSPATTGGSNALGSTPKADIAKSDGGNGGRLLKFALANLRRRPEQFVLSTLGIALAITAVVVVRTISIGFAGSGTASLGDVLHGAPLWVVPSQGVHYDAELGVLLPAGPAPRLVVPDGWTAQRTIAGIWAPPAGRVAVYGRSDIAGSRAVVGAAAAKVLGVRAGSRLAIGGVSLTVAVEGSSRIVSVATPVAANVVGDSSWLTVRQPASLAGRLDLGKLLSRATGIPSSTDPAVKPAASGLIYDTVGGGGSLTFQQRYSALFAGKVTGSVLGMVSTVGLLLGFVIAVTSFLASVQERRREFGIMASIGLADEVLYFFLVESAVVFVIAYLAAAALAGIAVLTLVPDVASVSAWLQACGMAAAYVPAMAIIGALVPVHRLLQQRPVALLAEST
ncbi:MAG: putative transport system permease protein [Pseudonocardiales bacterium]|nr:putative transport system permease protein [Pseudonocardiales bacterium]